MARHRRFADRAGFTRHCWECKHAKDWEDERATCEVYGIRVSKYSSPNNGVSRACGCMHYEMEEANGRVRGRA